MYERILIGHENTAMSWGIAKDNVMLYFQTLFPDGDDDDGELWVLPSESGNGDLGNLSEYTNIVHPEYTNILHRQPLSDAEAAMAIFQIEADDGTIIWSREEMEQLLESLD